VRPDSCGVACDRGHAITHTDVMHDEILHLTEQLLDAIGNGDWDTYETLCTDDLSCFEPEARGHLVHGLPFHRFYFEAPDSLPRQHTTLSAPHVRPLGGDAALIAYVRLIQRDGVTLAFEETRIWQRIDGQWRHVHFHRSPVA